MSKRAEVMREVVKWAQRIERACDGDRAKAWPVLMALVSGEVKA